MQHNETLESTRILSLWSLRCVPASGCKNNFLAENVNVDIFAGHKLEAT